MRAISDTKSVARKLAATALVAAVIGCAVPQTTARQGGQVVTFDERIASLTEAERDQLQQSMLAPEGFDAETKAARDAFFAWLAARDGRDTPITDRARDYEREAGPMGGMGYASAPATHER